MLINNEDFAKVCYFCKNLLQYFYINNVTIYRIEIVKILPVHLRLLFQNSLSFERASDNR